MGKYSIAKKRANKRSKENTIFQTGTIGSLINGIYKGDTDLSLLTTQGNFGIGTFDKMDGEMILLEGQFYQITGNGKVKLPHIDTKTPFATVTFFHAEKNYHLDHLCSYQELEKLLIENIPSPNIIYAIRIEGEFEYLCLRSIKAQKPPFVPLNKILKTSQNVYQIKHSQGVLVGFYFPNYMAAINVVGCHFHYLDHEKKKGGHIINLKVKSGLVEMSASYQFTLRAIKTKSFETINLIKGLKNVKNIEKGEV